MPGPAPKPTALRLIEGNPGKRAINAREPQPARGARMPAGMCEAAQAAWKLYAKQLTPLGLLTRVDATALQLLCEASARFSQANARLAADGMMITAKKYGDVDVLVPHPALRIVQLEGEIISRMLQQFGMTPAARSKVSAASDDGPANPWANL